MTTKANLYKSIHGSFEKLNKLNYGSWKDNISSVLESLDALNIVLGEEEAPPALLTTAGRLTSKLYRTRHAQAVSIIRFSVNDEIQQRLRGIANPVEMWKSLQKEYDLAVSEAGRTKIAREFVMLRYNGTERISEYFARLKLHRLPLFGTEEEISDQVVISHIYVTIPATYNGVIHRLQEKPKAEATLDYVTERLTEYEKINLANPSTGDPN
jgi:hypothetical protein